MIPKSALLVSLTLLNSVSLSSSFVPVNFFGGVGVCRVALCSSCDDELVDVGVDRRLEMDKITFRKFPSRTDVESEGGGMERCALREVAAAAPVEWRNEIELSFWERGGKSRVSRLGLNVNVVGFGDAGDCIGLTYMVTDDARQRGKEWIFSGGSEINSRPAGSYRAREAMMEATKVVCRSAGARGIVTATDPRGGEKLKGMYRDMGWKDVGEFMLFLLDDGDDQTGGWDNCTVRFET